MSNLDFLFIENVGNLVCPSSYDLGEDLRSMLLSVTEGKEGMDVYLEFLESRRLRFRTAAAV